MDYGLISSLLHMRAYTHWQPLFYTPTLSLSLPSPALAHRRLHAPPQLLRPLQRDPQRQQRAVEGKHYGSHHSRQAQRVRGMLCAQTAKEGNACV